MVGPPQGAVVMSFWTALISSKSVITAGTADNMTDERSDTQQPQPVPLRRFYAQWNCSKVHADQTCMKAILVR